MAACNDSMPGRTGIGGSVRHEAREGLGGFVNTTHGQPVITRAPRRSPRGHVG